MVLDCQFIKLDHSEALKEYASQKLEKINKIHNESMHVLMTVSKQGHNKIVSIKIMATNIVFKSTAKNSDYYAAVDIAVDKVIGQARKRRAKLKNHKNYEVTVQDNDKESWDKSA